MKQERPLMENVDYTDFVTEFVKSKLAQFDVQAEERMILYISQDLESYLLDSGKTIKELDSNQAAQVDLFVKESIQEWGNIHGGRK
jgi:hypothetical protein